MISTASRQPRSALNRIMSGGRPPLDEPSPSGSTRSAESRSFTTLVTVGALSPEARTRSAFEQEPHSRSNLRIPWALVWRRTEGLPIGMGLFFTVLRKYMRLTMNPASMFGHAESARRRHVTVLKPQRNSCFQRLRE